jgi:hypothetical protein
LRPIQSSRPSSRTRACNGPWRSSDDVVITTSAPPSRQAATSAAESTPDEAAREQLTSPCRRLIQARDSAASAGTESRNPAETVNVSGSMSVCRNRLNSTSPSAPAWSSTVAIWPSELKYGDSFTATGIETTALTAERILV